MSPFQQSLHKQNQIYHAYALCPAYIIVWIQSKVVRYSNKHPHEDLDHYDNVAIRFESCWRKRQIASNYRKHHERQICNQDKYHMPNQINDSNDPKIWLYVRPENWSIQELGNMIYHIYTPFVLERRRPCHRIKGYEPIDILRPKVTDEYKHQPAKMKCAYEALLNRACTYVSHKVTYHINSTYLFI